MHFVTQGRERSCERKNACIRFLRFLTIEDAMAAIGIDVNSNKPHRLTTLCLFREPTL
jgi:hypothetical protein